MSAPNIVDVARWLQSRHGCHVFALDHPGRPECGGSHRECDGQRGKHPRGKWSQLATASPRIIAAMLCDGPWNVGIACKLSSLLVVDEDKPGAFHAFAASINEVVEPTFTVSTSKGCHYYYQQTDGAPLGNGRGQLAGHGIDVRGGGTGNGGYVVGPGSVHATGVIYTPLDSAAQIAPIPAWLAAVLRPSSRTGPAASPRRPGSTVGALKGLIRVVLDAAPGERNASLYWSACRGAELVAAGRADESAITDVLASAAVRVGLPESEALRTIASAMRSAGRGMAQYA